MSEYTYSILRRLCHIRIIELLPAQDPASGLRCNIRVVDLQDEGCQYEALSYTWGKPEFSRTLQVGTGRGGDAIIRVTPSAATALQHLRYPDRIRNLWVDAICINQKDDKEKSTQIPLMRDIYRRASRVVISLGDSEQGIQDLAMLRDFTLDVNLEKATARDACRRAAESMERLIKLPWFGRRWIIQEAVLNPDVAIFCGGSCMAWPKLLAHVARLQSKMSLGDQGVKRLLTMMEIWYKTALKQSEGSFRLKDDLIAFEDSDCTDPRDRIFALTGLDPRVKLAEPGEPPAEESDADVESSGLVTSDSSDYPDSSDDSKSDMSKPDKPNKPWITGDVVIRADYTMNTEEVYTAFATAAIQGGYFVWVLWQAAVRQGQAAPDLPSWVPDWRRYMDPRIANTPLPGSSSAVLQHSCFTSQSTSKGDGKPLIGLCLSLARHKIGGLPKYHELRVTHIYPPFPKGDVLLTDVEYWLVSLWGDHKRRPMKNKAAKIDFCRRLDFDNDERWGLLSDIMSGEYEDCDEVDDVLIHIQRQMEDRAVFAFQSGHVDCIGIGTSSVQEGDYIIYVQREELGGIGASKREMASFLLREVSDSVLWKKAAESRRFHPDYFFKLVGWCEFWDSMHLSGYSGGYSYAKMVLI